MYSNHNQGDHYGDGEDLARARQLWHNFTGFIKWGIVACAVVLVLLALITL